MEDEMTDLDLSAHRQRQELMAAAQTESDLELAFHLQMEETMAASLVLHPSSSALPLPAPPHHPTGGDGDDHNEVSVMRVQDMELERFQQERRDNEQCREEMRRLTEELRRQAHDERFARDLLRIPDDEWEDTGDWFERPMKEGFGEGEEPFKLYFKGLCEPMIEHDGNYISAVGVAICNPQGKVVLKIQKPTLGPQVSRKIVETEALIEGLRAVLSLGIKNVDVFFQHTALYHHITGKWAVKQHKLADIVNQALALQQKLEACRMFLLPRCDMQFVFGLARDAIDTQLMKAAEHKGKGPLKETCRICLEDTDLPSMFEVDGCLHRFCFSCMKQHVEVKLLDGSIPGCPYDGCNTRLNVESSTKFLTPKLAEIMSERVIEASIPPAEKVYCPYPKCSALMSRSETIHPEQGSSSRQTSYNYNEHGLRKCIKCNGLFCITCKVPWHFGLSCYDYKIRNPYPRAEDAKFQSLANRNTWRQCIKCNHMIELLSGCFHMTCRCGYEFCYTCGAAWKDKKRTCRCPLWRNENILDEEVFEDDENYRDYEIDDAHQYRFY
ncbi:hypothetical protein Taro_030831 [Colocasia esculenta]|uniref:RBR-type E3 ubiquitin transferase n=1 Tax=Colocasia esculenta TaxID=4460 RepID=A0A843VQ70_COLES|nr:hypothetical protein [Colocasia esculenta]